MSTLKIDDIPLEILLIIFSNLDVISLCRLSRTCKKFYEIILQRDSVWFKAGNNSLITNLSSDIVKERSQRLLGSREKCRIASNWKEAVYQENHIKFGRAGKYMPWMILEKEYLWFTKGNHIEVHDRKNKKCFSKFGGKKSSCVFKTDKEDLSKFVIKHGVIASGGRDGGIYGWDYASRSSLFKHPHLHESDVHDVDVSQEVLVSASRDRDVKIWSLQDLSHMDDETIRPKYVLDLVDRVWSVGISPWSNVFATGSSGHSRLHSLRIFDLTEGVSLMKGEGVQHSLCGILDLIWHSPNVLLTCGYDSCCKIWDTRTGRCEMFWEDPLDATLYCVQTDHENAIMCGTGRHARVQLWDRRARKGLQLYFARSKHSSPVYSIAFDPSNLYIALDESISLMDFSCTSVHSRRKFHLDWIEK